MNRIRRCRHDDREQPAIDARLRRHWNADFLLADAPTTERRPARGSRRRPRRDFRPATGGGKPATGAGKIIGGSFAEKPRSSLSVNPRKVS